MRALAREEITCLRHVESGREHTLHTACTMGAENALRCEQGHLGVCSAGAPSFEKAICLRFSSFVSNFEAWRGSYLVHHLRMLARLESTWRGTSFLKSDEQEKILGQVGLELKGSKKGATKENQRKLLNSKWRVAVPDRVSWQSCLLFCEFSSKRKTPGHGEGEPRFVPADAPAGLPGSFFIFMALGLYKCWAILLLLSFVHSRNSSPLML